MTEFDTYASEYDAALNQGLAISGEDKMYFVEGRVRWLSQCLKRLRLPSRSVLDFGCGIGAATPALRDLLQPETIVGLDVSPESLQLARSRHADSLVSFDLPSIYDPSENIDVVYCNGVFHHIPLAERLDTVRYIARCLRPRGVFALWENNPWNPGTRLIMRRIPFDRDAIMLSAHKAASLLVAAGLRVLRTDYRFVFPRFLRAMRGIEDYMTGLPVGAQYQILAQKAG
jgi:SAM-dependent methyltransferase